MKISTDLSLVKTIFFDVGNTLLLPNPSVEDVCVEILEGHGLSVGKKELLFALEKADRYYDDQYWKDDKFWLKEVDAAKFWAGLYELMLKEVGIEDNASDISMEIYNAFGKGHRWKPFSDVVPVFKKLVGNGYSLGLISNWDTRLATLMIETGLSEYLDFVVSSASVGFLKPQPQIFEIALKRADALAIESIHVGDHYYADIMGARSVGITPVLLDRNSKVDSSDCLLIRDLHELFDHLEAKT